MAFGPRIEVGDLPRLRRTAQSGAADGPRSPFLPKASTSTARWPTTSAPIVQRAMEQVGNVRKRAARLLGISFRSLGYRLAKLGMDEGNARSERSRPPWAGRLGDISLSGPGGSA